MIEKAEHRIWFSNRKSSASAFVVWALTNLVVAADPEPLPDYAQARQLREDATLRAVAFHDRRRGIACGDRGTILATGDGGTSWTLRNVDVDCRLDDVMWLDSQRVVIVGGGYDRITGISRGVALYSHDGGETWQRSRDDDLPRLIRLHAPDDGSLVAVGDWSFAALARHFESRDGGLTWNGDPLLESVVRPNREMTPQDLGQWVATTGVPVAVRDACRISDSALCAVGDHGAILVSLDNGQAWSTARGANRQTAVLIVANQPASVAWALLGSEAIEYRNRVALLTYQDVSTVGIDVVSQAAVMLGGSGADAISQTGRDVRQSAVDWMTVHRPSVVILDGSLPSEVQAAFVRAATSLGVARVGVYVAGAGSDMRHRDALLPKSGVLTSDLSIDAMHLVAPMEPTIASMSLRYPYDASGSSRRSDSVTSGVDTSAGQSLEAAAPQVSRRQLQVVQARLSQRTRLRALFQSPRTPQQVTDALTVLLDQTPRGDQFRMAWSVFQMLPELASESMAIQLEPAILKLIATRFADLSAGRWARLKLDAAGGSQERARLQPLLEQPAGGAGVAVALVSPFQDVGVVRQASAITPIRVATPEVYDLSPKAKQLDVDVDLSWEFHPLVLHVRDAIRRRGEDGALQVPTGLSAELKRLVRAKENAWSWLLSDRGPLTTVARRAVSKPKLDGVLDDECWKTALQSPADTKLRVAYDEDFVYVAMVCPSNQLRAEREFAIAAPRRPTALGRDQDLTGLDRMLLRIDTDRDLLTAFELQIRDSRQTFDAIDGIPNWQPEWYVDTNRNGESVTMEAAIRRRDLVELPIQPGDRWYVSATPLRAKTRPPKSIMPQPTDWMRVVFGR